jgi:hypothetical protein
MRWSLSTRYQIGSVFWLVLDYLATLGKFLLALVLALFAAGLINKGVLSAYPWIQVFFIVVFLGIDAYLISVLFDRGARTRMFLWLIRDDVLGWHFPIVATSIMFYVLALAIFTTAAVLFEGWGIVDIRDSACSTACALDAASVASFFTWHLAEAVPLVRISESLQWNTPLVYEGALAGWLVLGFKVAVIIPLIQSIRIYWRVLSETPRLRLRVWPRITQVGKPVKVSWSSVPPPGDYEFFLLVEPPPVAASKTGGGEPTGNDTDLEGGSADDDLRRSILVREVFGERWTLWLSKETRISSMYTPSLVGLHRFQAFWVRASDRPSNTRRAVSVHVKSK